MQISFTEHPASVGETYLEHMGKAGSFARGMILCGFACLVHALFPFLFATTGSRAVATLYDRMVVDRVAKRPAAERSDVAIGVPRP